jgi:hypothetical protein
MNIIEFTNLLKINNNPFISNNITFFLGNLSNFNIKKIIKKPINKLYKCVGVGEGGCDGKDKGKINNLEEFIFSDTKFIARLIHGDSTDIKGKTHTIKFVSLDDLHENSIGCATLNYDYEKKTAYVQSIGDYGNCVFCPSKNVNFRIGQILMMMIISLCMEKKNIMKIELTDISKFNCLNTYNKDNNEYIINSKYKLHDNFNLMIISTLMKGSPYYTKYGFEPKYNEDKEILIHNIKIFNKKIKLSEIDLINYILNNKNNLDKNIKTEKYESIINKIIIPEIKKFENNSVDKFIYSILNINPEKKDDKIILCNIILSFYKYVFNKMKYRELNKKIFVKNL